MPDSKSARVDSPLALSPAISLRLRHASGICLPTTPSNSMLVALPMSLGPTIVKVTLTTARSRTKMTGAFGPEHAHETPERPRKSFGFSAGLRRPRGSAAPGTALPGGRSGVAAARAAYLSTRLCVAHATSSAPSCEATISR